MRYGKSSYNKLSQRGEHFYYSLTNKFKLYAN